MRKDFEGSWSVTRFLVLFLFAVTAMAAGRSNTEQKTEDIRSMTEVVAKYVQGKLASEAPGCFQCAGDQAAPKSCRDAYADLYSKPVLEFRITLGYTDIPNDVVNAEDGPRREVWVTRLVKPCPEGVVGTCGFAQDGDDADHFTKNVKGPDGKDHLVNLYLVNSSVGVDDRTNRTTLKAQQDAQTRRAEENFFGGLRTADIVIYAGHARKGGGPSFSPPILHKDGLNTNESAYASRVSETRMLTTLRANPNPPKLMGLFACDAGKWFSEDVRTATRRKSGVASSIGLTEPEIVFAQAYAMLDSILALRCQDQFNRSIDAITNVIRHDGRGAELDGFFTDVHPSFVPAQDEPSGGEPPTGEVPMVEEKDRSPEPLTRERPIRPAGDQPPGQDSSVPTQGADGVR
jgi:hypothetical protein